MVTALNVSEYHHIQEKISEMIIGLETMKALLDRSELEAKEDEWGQWFHMFTLYLLHQIFSQSSTLE